MNKLKNAVFAVFLFTNASFGAYYYQSRDASSITGTVPVVNGGTGTSTAFTQGSVLFSGASGVYTQNNSSFYWDNSNNRLGIGTVSPAYPLSVSGIIKTSQQIRSASNRETLSGNKTIAATDPQYQFLNPNGSNRDVTLPSATQEMFFVIKNIGSAGNTLIVKDSGGTAVTGGTIANNVAMGFYYDGTAWQLL